MARQIIVTLILVAGTVFAPPRIGAAQQPGGDAAIHQGTCEVVGDPVAPLVALELPQGERRGNAAAMPAGNSFTTVPVSLSTLTASNHVIVVPSPIGAEPIACGEIGGSLTEAGALVVGLRPQGNWGIAGIAYLSPSADGTATNISLFLTGEGVDLFLSATFSPPTVAEDDAARFTAALAGRDEASRVAGPLAGAFVQRENLRTVRGAGVAATDFSATVTVTNPTEQTETPWGIGFAFHRDLSQSGIPEVGVSSGGTWYFSDPATGALGAGPLDTFDATPGATNTLDLVVEGSTALLGVNGELATRLDLGPPTADDVILTTSHAAEEIVEGREIAYSGFEVWGMPGSAAQAAPAGTAEVDAAQFAAALAARDGDSLLAGPFSGQLSQSMAGLAARPAGIAAERFSASVTFVNPMDEPAAVWDYGMAFHLNPQTSTIQEVYLDAHGFWYYTDFPSGIQQSGAAPAFDQSPGGTNTLDLIVEGSTAQLGINGEFVARIELPAAMTADVMAATDFVGSHVVEGRTIAFTDFAVWK